MTRWLQAAKLTTGGNGQSARESRPGAAAKPGNGLLSVKSVLSEGESIATAPLARAVGLDPDAGAYLDRLNLHGPATYGAMASAMGWGATRAWRAEAKLRAAGLVHFHEGKAGLTERGRT